MATLTMYRRVPRDTPANIRIIARTLNLHRINSSEIDALCRIRWWQSWGFDPFEPTDQDEAFASHIGRPWVPASGIVLDDVPLTQEGWNRMVEEALRVGEPGYMMVPQGTVRPAGEEIHFQNEWPRVTRHTFPEPITIHDGESLLTRVDAAGQLQGLVIQEHDPLRNRYRINGEWVDEIDLFNLDDLPDM